MTASLYRKADAEASLRRYSNCYMYLMCVFAIEDCKARDVCGVEGDGVALLLLEVLLSSKAGGGWQFIQINSTMQVMAPHLDWIENF